MKLELNEKDIVVIRKALGSSNERDNPGSFYLMRRFDNEISDIEAIKLSLAKKKSAVNQYRKLAADIEAEIVNLEKELA